MLLFTLLNLYASTGQTNGQTTCKECDEIGKIEKSANEWDKHTRDSQNYAKQLRENARWRRNKHPYHAPQKAIAKAKSTNTTNVSTPVNVTNTNNNTNNSSSTNIISVSKTTAPSTAAVPEVSVSTAAPAAAPKLPAVSVAPTTTSNTPPVVSTTTSNTPPAVMPAPTAPIKA